MDTSTCYSVRSVSELEAYLAEHDPNSEGDFEQLPGNHAHVYRLDNGTVVLIPPHIGTAAPGLLFDSEACYQHFARLGWFPLESQEPDMFEMYRDELEGVDFRRITLEMLGLTGWEGDPDRLVFDHASVAYLLGEVKRRGLVKNRAWFRATLLLGELLRQKHNGRWVLIGRYGTVNPYFYPAIVTDNSKLIMLFSKANFFWNSPGDFGVARFLEISFIKEPTIESSYLDVVKEVHSEALVKWPDWVPAW